MESCMSSKKLVAVGTGRQKMHPTSTQRIFKGAERGKHSVLSGDLWKLGKKRTRGSPFPQKILEERIESWGNVLLITSCLGRTFCAELREQTWVWWRWQTLRDWRSLERQTWAAHSCIWVSLCPAHTSVQWAWRVAGVRYLPRYYPSVASTIPLRV